MNKDCKIGMLEQAPFTNVSYNAFASLLGLYQNMKDPNVFLVESNLGSFQTLLFEQFGAPKKFFIKYNFSSPFAVYQADAIGDGFGIELLIENKQKTRLPETMWFGFEPNIELDTVLAFKSGEYVQPNKVVVNGTFHLHNIAPNGCVQYKFNGNANGMRIYSLDAGMSAFVPKGFEHFTDIVTPFIQSDLSKGVSFALVNNFWGTKLSKIYDFEIYLFDILIYIQLSAMVSI